MHSMITKKYVPGIGWIRQGTLSEIWDYIIRQALIKDCADPTGIELPEWEWYHLN